MQLVSAFLYFFFPSDFAENGREGGVKIKTLLYLES